MKRFDLFKQVDVNLAAAAIVCLGQKFSDNEAALVEHLNEEITEAELQQINAAAQEEGRLALIFIP